MSLSKDILFGLAIGDALGVPVEFEDRESLKANPVKEMIGFGTHNQPPGTWSDDSSLSFCLAEAILEEKYEIKAIAQKFIEWRYNSKWTPHGEVFDIGGTTQDAISRLKKGIQPELAGGMEDYDNGNGSLMRILPLIFEIIHKPIEERFEITKQVSSLTHAHIRSVISCFYYLEFARGLIQNKKPLNIYKELQNDFTDFLQSKKINPEEINKFNRLLKGNIYEVHEDEIKSGGYVLHTLEASIWCLLNTNSYENAVLKAVNFGEDTDTTGAVTGGLAGILYGFNNIPKSWINSVVKNNEIEILANNLYIKYNL
jgi:ADP-ribosyl-[dinitrogen reductase] hydrolase